jgi:hypothetical protein
MQDESDEHSLRAGVDRVVYEVGNCALEVVVAP